MLAVTLRKGDDSDDNVAYHLVRGAPGAAALSEWVRPVHAGRLQAIRQQQQQQPPHKEEGKEKAAATDEAPPRPPRLPRWAQRAQPSALKALRVSSSSSSSSSSSRSAEGPPEAAPALAFVLLRPDAASAVVVGDVVSVAAMCTLRPSVAAARAEAEAEAAAAAAALRARLPQRTSLFRRAVRLRPGERLDEDVVADNAAAAAKKKKKKVSAGQQQDDFDEEEEVGVDDAAGLENPLGASDDEEQARVALLGDVGEALAEAEAAKDAEAAKKKAPEEDKDDEERKTTQKTTKRKKKKQQRRKRRAASNGEEEEGGEEPDVEPEWADNDDLMLGPAAEEDLDGEMVGGVQVSVVAGRAAQLSDAGKRIQSLLERGETEDGSGADAASAKAAEDGRAAKRPLSPTSAAAAAAASPSAATKSEAPAPKRARPSTTDAVTIREEDVAVRLRMAGKMPLKDFIRRHFEDQLVNNTANKAAFTDIIRRIANIAPEGGVSYISLK